MAVKKSVNRKSTKSRTNARTRSRSRKPKVKLDKNNILILTGAIALACVILMIVTALSTKTPLSSNSKTQITQRPDTEKESVIYSSKNKKENTAQTKKTDVQVNKNSLSSQNQVTQKKAEENKKNTVPQNKNIQPKKNTQLASVKNPSENENKILQKEIFNFPQAENNATLYFVIDDAGQNVSNLKEYTSLPMPLTIAVLPKLSHTKDCAYLVRSSGKELILHQPMKGHGAWDPGEGAVLPDSGASEIESLIKENILELGSQVKGFNNHEGSVITSDLVKMEIVLDVARTQGIYFIDSKTSSDSKAKEAALEHGITIFERNAPFIDNEISRDAMKAQIIKGLEVANKNGYAIMIGHVDKSVKILPQLLRDMYPQLLKKGYKISTPSNLK